MVRTGRACGFGTGAALRLDNLRDAPLAALPIVRYGREDGLLARDYLSLRGVATDAHGRVGVASTSELQVFDPASETATGSAAQLVWDTCRAGFEDRSITAGDAFPAGTTPLVFAARLLAFEREEHIQYRVQLLGLHAVPQPWTSDHRFEFSRLAAGRYDVRICARDAYGMVSAPLHLPFRVLAPCCAVVVQAVAARLRLGVRDNDMLVRWGGEEFLLALNACDPSLAGARLRAVLAAVSDQAIVLGETKLRISVSAGAAAYLPPGDADQQTAALAVEQAVARADAALYEAKARGRDRAVLVVDGAEGVVGNARWTEFERVAPTETHAK